MKLVAILSATLQVASSFPSITGRRVRYLSHYTGGAVFES